MDAKDFLSGYSQKAEEHLDKFFATKACEAAKVSPIYRQMLDIYHEHLSGGKKARGALMVLGYCLAGGKPDKKIFSASLFPEIVHSFLLIHDDIMDRGFVRRGKPTPEIIYRDFYQKNKFKGEADHFGLSMAIDLGDFGMYLGQEVIFQSGFPKERIFSVVSLANKIYQEVAVGQALDIFGGASGEFNEDYVLKIHLLKTARYSISGPLQFGALLAGAEEKTINSLASYGEPIGIAFQLQDDELGFFGKEKELGKMVGARDIKEGKVTLLAVKGFALADKNGKEFLKKVYGSKRITDQEVDRVKAIIQNSGALAYSQKMSRELVEKGKRFVPKITKNPELQDTLYKMADYMVERES